MIQDHPDFDKSPMRWCEHENYIEVEVLGLGNYYFCLDCGDNMAKQDAVKWAPKLIGTRIERK